MDEENVEPKAPAVDVEALLDSLHVGEGIGGDYVMVQNRRVRVEDLHQVPAHVR